MVYYKMHHLKSWYVCYLLVILHITPEIDIILDDRVKRFFYLCGHPKSKIQMFIVVQAKKKYDKIFK